jgi:hypothetical protein
MGLVVGGKREGSSGPDGELSPLDEAEMCAAASESWRFNNSKLDPYKWRSPDSETDSCSPCVVFNESGRSGRGQPCVWTGSDGELKESTWDREKGEKGDGV